MAPRRILSLGSDHGAAVAALRQRFPSAGVVAVDNTPDPLPGTGAQVLCANLEALPLRNASVDVIFANLSLAYSANLVACLNEARRTLATPGLLSFASLGRDAFKELRKAWATADTFTHVTAQPDMHDLGDLLIHSGFAEPVLDTDLLTVTYTRFDDLVRDLRAAAAVNNSANHNPGLTSRAAAQRLQSALEATRDASGRFSISVEVIYGQAWSTHTPNRGQLGDVFEISPEAITRPLDKSNS